MIVPLSLVFTLTAVSILYFVLSLFVSARRHARQAKEWNCLPAPSLKHKLPFGIDNVIRMLKADKEHRAPQETMDSYLQVNSPTFMQSLIGPPIIVTHDPKNVQAVLATQFRDFEIGPQRRSNFFPMLGIGIFTADGKDWEHSRAALRPQFARGQISDLELEETHVQNLLRCLPVGASGWTSDIDLGPLFFRLTLDSATEFLFGESILSQLAILRQNSHDGGAEFEWRNLAAAFDHGTSVLGVRARLAAFYWLYNPQSFRDDCRAINEFADACIDRRSKAMSHSEKSDRYVFLDELLKMTNDRVDIRSQLLNILLAGRDTTAGLLGWTIWSLARHPHVFHKLRTAILEEFGGFDDKNEITFTQLKNCSYLQYVMNEVLRLYPSVPINARQATKDTTIPRGGGPDGLSPVYVYKGQEVSYSVYVMHRRRDIWGPDADEFNPDRWVGRKTGWEFLPFNGGPRICLGQQFALTEAGYVITRLLQRFDKIEKANASDEELHQYSVTTAPKNVFVRLHESK